MCDPVTIGLILTAAGAATTSVNNNQAMRRQDREAARGIRQQGKIQREANQRVVDEIDALAASTGAGERAEALEGFREALRAGDERSTGALRDVPNANARFAEDVGQGRAQVNLDAEERAGRLATIDSAVLQRLNEGISRQGAVDDLRDVARRSRAEDFLNQLRIAEIRPNEWVDALGSIMSGVGSGLTMGGTGGALAGLFGTGATKASTAYRGGTLIDSPSTNPYAAAARGVMNA